MHVPLQGRPGSRGCIPDAPRETGIHLEWKQRTPLCSRVATGISWSSLGGLKGVKPPEAFGERRLVITVLPRSKRLLISWLQSPFAVILEPPKIKSDTVSTVSPTISHEVMGPDAMIFVF